MGTRMVEETVISAAEAADILGVTLNNLRQLQNRKRIQWVKKSGRNVYYKLEDILAFRETRLK